MGDGQDERDPDDGPSVVAAVEPSDSPGGETGPSTPSGSQTWASRHPWGVALITGVLVVVATSGFNWFRSKDDPIALGRTGAIGSFSFTASDLRCGPRDADDDRAAFDEPPESDLCRLDLVIRNNGRSAGRPFVDYVLHVGRNRYEGDDLLTVDIFPEQSREVEIRVPVAPDSSPTRLYISPSFGESFLGSILPFYNERIIYDVS